MAPTRSAVRAASLLCLVAAASALPQAVRRDEPFTRLGCYAGTVDGHRALQSDSLASDSMTVETCAAHCSKHKYFGLEYGRECYCGDDQTAAEADAADCSMPCAGDSSESCGAGGRQDLYINNLYVPVTPAKLDVPYLGCFVDEGARALPDNLLGADDMTAAKCAPHCAEYTYFGVEYGRECWCGNSAPKTPAPASECSMPCAGDDAQLCGAGNRINVWGAPIESPVTVGDYQYQGCYTDKQDQRSLTGKSLLNAAMTLEMCATTCADYPWFGLEYGTQCYCGTELKSTAEKRPQAECSMRCGGDPKNVCGDADRLNVYNNKANGTGENVPEVGDFTYQSCWTDSVSTRSLTGAVYRGEDMTVEECASRCGGFAYFGLEYSNECFCGNDLGGEAALESECSELCAGDKTEWCGGPGRLSLYATDDVCSNE